MFKLNKSEEAKLDALIEDARSELEELNNEIIQANYELERIKDNVGAAVTRYNGELRKLRAFIEAWVEEWRTEWEDKSEKWQDSERGEAISQWMDEWQNVMLEEAELDLPDDINNIDDPFDELEHLSRDASENV